MIRRLFWLLSVAARRNKTVHQVVEVVARVWPAAAASMEREPGLKDIVRPASAAPAPVVARPAAAPAPGPVAATVASAAATVVAEAVAVGLPTPPAPMPAIAPVAPVASAPDERAVAADPAPAPLRPLGAKEAIDGSVWVMRILWALEHAARHELGPQNAADIARLLTTHAGLNVPSPNVARAFRERKQAQKDELYWAEAEGQRYAITEAGRAALREKLADA